MPNYKDIFSFVTHLLWPPYVIGGALYFCPVISIFFYLLSFFPCLISAIAEWMSAILPHMAWLHVWNVLHRTCWKYRTQKGRQNSPSGHHRTTLLGYIFTTKACINNWKKLIKQQYVLQMSPRYGELRPTSGWDRSGSLGHPYKFQRLSRLCSVTARQSSSERQPNFAALNRWRHLCLAGQPSRWALAHILV